MPMPGIIGQIGGTQNNHESGYSNIVDQILHLETHKKKYTVKVSAVLSKFWIFCKLGLNTADTFGLEWPLRRRILRELDQFLAWEDQYSQTMLIVNLLKESQKKI
jgi:hypothetical protein